MPRRPPVLAASLAALTLGACSAAPPAASSRIPAEQDPGVAHVHGLGVDPADGVLYAATHFGLFRLPEQGGAARVADRFQDTMGFTVTGPNTFLGSGHPDFLLDPELPALLGLIRSTDAAESWQAVSLAGEVDFHALHAAHGNVYGWDSSSGRLMVSADEGLTWDTRSELDLRDFAVGPADPDSLLATTPGGLLRSADGGGSWEEVPGAPAISVLAWGEPGALFGVAPDGTVQRSGDGGLTWMARGRVDGEPEALAIDARDGRRTLYVAVSGGAILASRDDGATFFTRYAEE